MEHKKPIAPFTPSKIDDSWILDALMRNTADSIYVKDLQCRLMRISQKMAHDLGYPNDTKILGKTDVELFGEELGKRTLEEDHRVMTTREPIVGQVESYTTSSGKVNWTTTTKLPIMDGLGEVVGLLGITREINELKQVEQNLEHQATHDLLTSLPNRQLIMARIANSIAAARQAHSLLAVLFIDLDKFKAVNDQYGHKRGDQLLVELALVLSSNVRRSDTVARYGGDEFVILLEGINNPGNATKIAQTISRATRNYFKAIGMRTTVSIGISLYPANGATGEDLIQAADHAMYEAKTNNCGFQLAQTESD